MTTALFEEGLNAFGLQHSRVVQSCASRNETLQRNQSLSQGFLLSFHSKLKTADLRLRLTCTGNLDVSHASLPSVALRSRTEASLPSLGHKPAKHIAAHRNPKDSGTDTDKAANAIEVAVSSVYPALLSTQKNTSNLNRSFSRRRVLLWVSGCSISRACQAGM